MNSTSSHLNVNFLLLSLMLRSLHRSRRDLRFQSWSPSASRSVSHWPVIFISSAILKTPFSPSKFLSSFIWKFSGAGVILNGILWKRYLPQGVWKTFSWLDSSSNSTPSLLKVLVGSLQWSGEGDGFFSRLGLGNGDECTSECSRLASWLQSCLKTSL